MAQNGTRKIFKNSIINGIIRNKPIKQYKISWNSRIQNNVKKWHKMAQGNFKKKSFSIDITKNIPMI